MRILVIDDQVDGAELLASVIRSRGHEVAIANDAEQALAVARHFSPEIALIDVMIRCESGYLLARDLRELPGMHRCRFIAITGFVQEKHRETSEAAGFVRHLVKPLQPDAVYEAINAASALNP